MDRLRLRAGIERLGSSASSDSLERLSRYEELLQQWGRRMNLTTILDSDRILTHHFLDSVALLGALGPVGNSQSLVDVGSGAGFPGVVCALFRPDLQITLIERVQKKTAFLLTVRRELDLHFTVATGDIRAHRHQYDLAVSRAAFPPVEWLQVGSRIVAAGGCIIAMLGSKRLSLDAPNGFSPEQELSYDVGAGPKQLRTWRKIAVDSPHVPRGTPRGACE